jgi:hypothetical protein
MQKRKLITTATVAWKVTKVKTRRKPSPVRVEPGLRGSGEKEEHRAIAKMEMEMEDGRGDRCNLPSSILYPRV